MQQTQDRPPICLAELLVLAQVEAHRLTGRNTRYQVAKLAQVTQGNLKAMTDGRRPVPDALAIRLADLVGLPPTWVVACLHFEWKSRQGDETSQLWRQMADQVRDNLVAKTLP